MTKTKENWKITCNRCVAFLDIMGFKDMVMRKPHQDMYKILTDIFSISNEFERFDELKNNIYITKFSDTIVIFSKTDDIENVKLFLIAVEYLFASSMNKEIPLKAAIAYGKISVNKKQLIFVGQPIIDAYLLEENLKYYGIVCHNSFEKHLKTIDQNKTIEYTFRKKTNLKSGSITHLNIDWYNSYFGENKEKSIEELLEEISLNVSGEPRIYVDNTLDMYKKENEE